MVVEDLPGEAEAREQGREAFQRIRETPRYRDFLRNLVQRGYVINPNQEQGNQNILLLQNQQIRNMITQLINQTRGQPNFPNVNTRDIQEVMTTALEFGFGHQVGALD